MSRSLIVCLVVFLVESMVVVIVVLALVVVAVLAVALSQEWRRVGGKRVWFRRQTRNIP